MMAQLLLVVYLASFPVHTLFTSGRTSLLSNDQSTPQTTTVYVTVTAGNSVALYWGDGTSVALTADGALHVYTHDYSAGAYTIAVGGDIGEITDWRSFGQSFLSGDIVGFSALTGLAYLRMNATSVSGNISAISGLTSLTDVLLNNTSISGDISAISGLASLTLVYLYNTSISGDISSISGLTSLSRLYLYSTSISGDIGDLSGLTGLSRLYLFSTSLSYGSVSLPPWAGTNIQIQSAGLDSTEVDNFLIDLASGVGANGSLDISGTNAARTSASDAAKATLLAAGWSVTVNE